MEKKVYFKQSSLVNKSNRFQVLLFITNNSIKYQTLIYTQ